jgi:hypothetical protein
LIINRLSANLRDLFAAAKRAAEINGTLVSAHEVRAKIAVALAVVSEALEPIARAADRNDADWLAQRYADWKAEQCYLVEENQRLNALREQVDLLIETFRAT